MAGSSNLRALIEDFAREVEAVVKRQAQESFAARFEQAKTQLFGGAPVPAPAPTKGRVGRRPGRSAGFTFEPKPCPVCGKLNKARGLSFLCEGHRSPANLAKYKGASKTAGLVKRGPGQPPKVKLELPVAKRGPGRPRKVVAAAAPVPPVVKRGPGRPPKVKLELPVAKRGPGRPRKVVTAVAAPLSSSPTPTTPATPSSTPAAGSSDEAMCRFPGCPNKNSGPRYHKFCRDHFGKLSAEEREKYKAEWKAKHAA